jgi:hypothetical protein
MNEPKSLSGTTSSFGQYKVMEIVDHDDLLPAPVTSMMSANARVLSVGSLGEYRTISMAD